MGFKSFIESIPAILAGKEYRDVVESIAMAHRNGRCVILAMGAHVIKVGLSPIIIDLMRRGIVNAIATNGAGGIHDAEIALIGETSEDVSQGIEKGDFGMAEETGKLFADAALEAYECNRGLGEILGNRLLYLAISFHVHVGWNDGRMDE